MTRWTQRSKQRKWQLGFWSQDAPNDPATRETTSPTGTGRCPLESCRIHSPLAWVPSRWPPSDWLGFGPSEGTTHFYNSLDFDITCQQTRVAQTGAPITEQKDAFAEGCCACVYLYRRTFLVTCWHFPFARKLNCWRAGWICLQCTLEQNVSILAQVSLICLISVKEPTHHSQGRVWRLHSGIKADSLDSPGPDGAGRLYDHGRPCLSMDDGRPSTDTASNWLEVQRWWERVWPTGVKLHSDEDVSSGDAGKAHVPIWPDHRLHSSLRSNLDALCDRVALEKDWVTQTGTPKPRLEYQGSDAFLKKQFKYCSKGEIGYFAPKHIVSALPEEGERPTKSHRKFTVDGCEKEEEEEERPNPQARRQLERMHTVFRNNLLMCMLAFPQFQQFDLDKCNLDEWYDWFYGPEIAGRKPPPSECLEADLPIDGGWGHSQGCPEVNAGESTLLDPWGLRADHVPTTSHTQRAQGQGQRKTKGQDQDGREKVSTRTTSSPPQRIQGRR